MRKSKCGHRLHFSIWDCDWKLPERLHHADSGGDFHRFAGVALPTVQNTDQAVRQRAGVWVAVAVGQVPCVRAADLADVSLN
jgi:hypothetical protein